LRKLHAELHAGGSFTLDTHRSGHPQLRIKMPAALKPLAFPYLSIKSAKNPSQKNKTPTPLAANAAKIVTQCRLKSYSKFEQNQSQTAFFKTKKDTQCARKAGRTSRGESPLLGKV
jgi:hypothetical protein